METMTKIHLHFNLVIFYGLFPVSELFLLLKKFYQNDYMNKIY